MKKKITVILFVLVAGYYLGYSGYISYIQWYYSNIFVTFASPMPPQPFEAWSTNEDRVFRFVPGESDGTDFVAVFDVATNDVIYAVSPLNPFRNVSFDFEGSFHFSNDLMSFAFIPSGFFSPSAIFFYAEGQLVNRHYIGDLIRDHRRVLVPGLQDSIVDPENNTLTLKTIDNVTYVFDLRTGEILTSSPDWHLWIDVVVGMVVISGTILYILKLKRDKTSIDSLLKMWQDKTRAQKIRSIIFFISVCLVVGWVISLRRDNREEIPRARYNLDDYPVESLDLENLVIPDLWSKRLSFENVHDYPIFGELFPRFIPDDFVFEHATRRIWDRDERLYADWRSEDQREITWSLQQKDYFLEDPYNLDYFSDIFTHIEDLTFETLEQHAWQNKESNDPDRNWHIWLRLYTDKLVIHIGMDGVYLEEAWAILQSMPAMID